MNLKQALETKKIKINNKTIRKESIKTGNTFVDAINDEQKLDIRTDNGMKAYSTTELALVNLFAQSGNMRNQNIIPLFIDAFKENQILAMKLALYIRDIKEGQGNRKNFRDILFWLTSSYKYNINNIDNDIKTICNFINKIPELGRWDDLFYVDESYKNIVFDLIKKGLEDNNTCGLCAKWMPRQGKVANAIRNYLGIRLPKYYRQMLVEKTKVVEQKLCAKLFNEVEYEHVPSLAFKRYTNTFKRHDNDRFQEFLKSVEKGEKKINAKAIYPFDVIKNLENDRIAADLQWKNLPDFLPNNSNILVICDDSGSMNGDWGLPTSMLNIAHSLAIYTSERLKSAFKDLFMTFSETPRWMNLSNYKTLYSKVKYCRQHSEVANTNINAAFDLILNTAIINNVKCEDMPKTLLIISDMQFDGCVEYDESAIKMMKRKYKNAGYKLPNIVFWNLIGNTTNFPVTFNEKGCALISGFSPSILQYLGENILNPEQIMLKVLNNERYNIEN